MDETLSSRHRLTLHTYLKIFKLPAWNESRESEALQRLHLISSFILLVDLSSTQILYLRKELAARECAKLRRPSATGSFLTQEWGALKYTANRNVKGG
jgi:hypothetical protein